MLFTRVVCGLVVLFFGLLAGTYAAGWAINPALGAACVMAAFLIPIVMTYDRENRRFIVLMFTLLNGIGGAALHEPRFDNNDLVAFAYIMAVVGLIWLVCLGVDGVYEHYLQKKALKR